MNQPTKKIRKTRVRASDLHFSLGELLISHQNLDGTKWGVGMSISEWLEMDNIESAPEGREFLEKLIKFAINQVVLKRELLKKELIRSRIAYKIAELGVPLPDEHTDLCASHSFIAMDRVKLTRPHKVTIRLYGCLIPQQGPHPMWYKGGIQIGNRFQVMKWRLA